MRLEPRKDRAHNRVRREPLRSLVELAEEFGVKPRALQTYMHHHPGAPAPEMQLKSTVTRTGTTYYKPSLIRAWWASFKDSR